MAADRPLLSAVIPTRGRPDLLADALATLVAQDVAPGTLEVVVVDDGSEPPLGPVVAAATEAAQAAGGGIAVRGVRQPPSGLNPGRNRGASEARADLIAYLDDDVLVAPGWASAVLAAFERFGADALAGRILLQLEGPEPPWLTPGLRSYLSELDLGDEARLLEPGERPFGANLAITRAALDRLGGFAAGLDRIGASLISNGEIELFDRLHADGGCIAYAPDAWVHHRVPPGRLTREWFLRRARAQGESDALLHPAGSARADRLRAAGREVLRAGRAAPIAAKGLASGSGAFPAAVWLSYCRGRFAASARAIRPEITA